MECKDDIARLEFLLEVTSLHILTLNHTVPTFNDPEKKAFENIEGKEENAGNQHFLLYPQCFLPFPKRISFLGTFILLSVNAWNLDWSKILSFGRGLISDTNQNPYDRFWSHLLETSNSLLYAVNTENNMSSPFYPKPSPLPLLL